MMLNTPDLPDLQTDRLTIRLVDRRDLPDLLWINGNDAVTRYLPYASWGGPADADAWFDRMAARTASGDAAQFVIVERRLGRVIGSCLLFRHERAHARAELGYVLGEAFWGAGYMHEALRMLIGRCFGPWQLRRLEAEIDPRNTASARVLERLGFVREGLLRERGVIKGEVGDSALYGLLGREWLAD